ncbi:head completion/stabilization protein [Muribacter muris]|uniref:Head completion/stabilization protein n=1 Tax=Muribacter muris TaxID=67855 RepID=A0A4Y9K857_9PAST|nr:head completion/stabilization protein [Muribacter muris]MBF0783893.1 head completion/stabilization protein [Muribacter muris]MBF0826391.1 head completion/stabilization protein [Muribacter muris]TFV13290.1 head completion/stabilization protein [Muribacter muris]
MSSISIPKVERFDSSKTPYNQTEISNEVISNNGFFPDLHLIDVRNAMRIDGTVTNERLKRAVIEAIATVNKDLKPFRLTQQTKGTQSLADSDDEQINGESVLVHHYKQAVFSLATALLYEHYRSFDSTKDGHDKSTELQHTAGDLRRDYHFAVREIRGENGLISELL